MTPEVLAYRCGILAMSLTACGGYLALAPGSVVDAIRADWMRRSDVAMVAMQLAAIAAGRAKPPPFGIEDTRARDWLDGLCD